MKTLTFCVLFLAHLCYAGVEHAVWNKIPIPVHLTVGEERVIEFPEAVSFGYDKTKLASILRVQNANDTLYLKPSASFNTERTEVLLPKSGQIVLLDISASKAQQDNNPLAIVLSKQADAAGQSHKTTTSVSMVELTRFALHTLYAPKRLITQPADIYRVPMNTSRTVPLYQGASVISMPIAEWKGGDHYITAVILRNQLKTSLDLDPRFVRGQFEAATFYPSNQLTPAGTSTDTTTLFLVSVRPFNVSLGA